MNITTMKQHLTYTFHHVGIPTDAVRADERYSALAGMHTSENLGQFRVQWHRFDADSPLHPMLRKLPHVAFQVEDLTAAIEGETVIPGPYEPIDDYRVAVVDDAGVPIELIQTSLPDEVLWRRAATGKGSLYRQPQDKSLA